MASSHEQVLVQIDRQDSTLGNDWPTVELVELSNLRNYWIRQDAMSGLEVRKFADGEPAFRSENLKVSPFAVPSLYEKLPKTVCRYNR